MDKAEHNAWRTRVQKFFPAVLWIAIILWRVPYLNKGIDYTDTGYNIEKYKYVFFGDGISDIGMFYTNLIGGIIYKALPSCQLLVFRYLHLFLWLLTIFFSYQLFKQYLNKTLLLVLYFGLTTLMGGEAIFSYYPLSQVLLTASLLLLHNGLINNKKFEIAASGFVSGINIFVRLPNLFYLSMLIGAIGYLIYSKRERKDIWRNILIYASGVISAVLLTFAVMTVFMGFSQAIDSFIKYVEVALGFSGADVENFLGIEEKSGHSLTAEIKMIGYQGIQAIFIFSVFFIPMLFISYIISLISKKIRSEYKSNIGKIITLICWIVFSVLFAYKLEGRVLYILGLASVVLSFVCAVIFRKKQQAYSLLCVLNILMSIFSVIGTDKGLQRFFIVRPMQIAVLIICSQLIYKYCSENMTKSHCEFFKNRVITKLAVNCLNGFCVLLCITVFSTGIICTTKNAYCDGAYSELTYQFKDEIPELKGMYTSEVRAEELNEYYNLMNADEIKDKEAAVFGYFPLGLVIGPQRDYFESVDPCVDYPRFSVEMLLEAIQEKEREGVIPVIVLSRVDQIQLKRSADQAITSEAKQAVIDYMLTLHNYRIYADTEYFSIYIAED